MYEYLWDSNRRPGQSRRCDWAATSATSALTSNMCAVSVCLISLHLGSSMIYFRFFSMLQSTRLSPIANKNIPPTTAATVSGFCSSAAVGKVYET